MPNASKFSTRGLILGCFACPWLAVLCQATVLICPFLQTFLYHILIFSMDLGLSCSPNRPTNSFPQEDLLLTNSFLLQLD